MKRRVLTISEENFRRLEWMIDRGQCDDSLDPGCLKALQAELQRARVVPREKVSEDVVTMNSVIRIRDLDTDEVEVYELVYPNESDVELNRVSVLAPIGMAILGYRTGDVIEWPVPAGLRRIQIDEVLAQPETAERVA